VRYAVIALGLMAACGREPPSTTPGRSSAPVERPASAAAPIVAAPIVAAPIVDYQLSGHTTCVVMQTGKVACLGFDSASGAMQRSPVIAAGIDDAVAIGGYLFGGIWIARKDGRLEGLKPPGAFNVTDTKWVGEGCVIGSDRSVWCAEDAKSVRKLAGLEGVVAFSTGENHRCFVLGSGRVKCIGSNGRGQLGVLAEKPGQDFHEVPGLTGVRGVAAGSEHTCALLSSGHVECWGSGYQGNTGPGDPPKRAARVRIPAINDAIEIAAADHGWSTCVLRRSGSINCWGFSSEWNRAGQENVLALPPLAGAHRLRVTNDAVCAIDGSGGLSCLGNPPLFAPVRVPGIATARTVIANSDQSCALLENGDVTCWGRIETRSGNEVTDTYQATPLERAEGATDIAGGTTPARMADFCITTREGGVTCVGKGNPTTRRVPGFKNAVQVVMGQRHVCARTRDGKVQCWGDNNNGQLGVPDVKAVSGDARDVPGVPAVTKIAAGIDATCALTKDSRVYCWGGAELLGDGRDEGAKDRAVPQPIAGLLARDIAMTSNLACAIDQSGSVHCWGSNSSGAAGAPSRIGDPNYVLHVMRPHRTAIANATSLWLGNPSCALTATGMPACWPAASTNLKMAVDFTSSGDIETWPITGVRSLALAGTHACLAHTDGSVQCVGDDEYGAVGGDARSRWVSLVSVRAQ
jgi:alpha-tubulin suppressor-like RCC1 family protein